MSTPFAVERRFVLYQQQLQLLVQQHPEPQQDEAPGSGR